MREIQLPYAIKNGKLIHISQVESGLGCGCVCPSCNKKLVARKGKKVEHHFAHYKGDSCSTALETALHLAAKEVLKDANRIALPAVLVDFSSGFRVIEIAEEKTYQIDSIRAEKKIGNIIPDLILEISGHQLLVEILVTHSVDSDKLRQINELGISTIEIDLSSAPRDLPMRALSELIVDRVDNKKWLNNERVNFVYKNLMEKSVRKKIGFSKGSIVDTIPTLQSFLGVKKCPEFMRRSNNDDIRGAGIHDCLHCKYCLEKVPATSYIPDMDYIYCIGHIPDALEKYKFRHFNSTSMFTQMWK